MSALPTGRPRSIGVLLATCVAMIAVVLGLVAPAAEARPAHQHHSGLGTTTVTTARGIPGTLVKAGILPLPTRGTGFGISFFHGLALSYAFPITGNTANLKTVSGDITHTGGIKFVSRSASLEIGKFDVDLGAGKIFATEVNFAPARIPVLDLDLAKLSVTHSDGDTVLRGISLKLDPAAAGALNSTFGTSLPADGSLVFGTASIRIKG